ncbi:MAG: FAD-binding oxidoreductase [Acidobacteriaceae bacterium]
MNEFVSIVGAQHVTEESGAFIVAPASTEETAVVLRLCSARKLTVSPRGGGTKLDWGNQVTPQVIVDTRRLDGIREHVWQDMTATVGAGTNWAEMEHALAEHKQHVALDPLFAAQATVGGVIAVNDSGALRMRYGSLRDLVIGMTIVLADGTIARSGGKVVKNVAGYDLPKLLTGSFGTLGITTEVTFRLHPMQPRAETWTVRSDEIEPLIALQQQLLTAAMSIESLEIRLGAVDPLFNGRVRLQPHHKDDRTDTALAAEGNTTGSFALDVRFASLPEVLREHEQRLRVACGTLALSTADENVWLQRERLFALPNMTLLKVTALPSKIGAILQGFRSLAASDIVAECVADATGIVTVALSAPPEVTAELIEDLRARLRGEGGMVVVLRAGHASAIPDRWGGSPPAIAVMRAIKQQFDPDRLLNPGKFVGGI